MKSIEKSAKTYEEALETALKELDASISDVDVLTLEEGSKGLFGLFGSRPYKIRVTLKENASAAGDELDVMSLLNGDKPKKKPEPEPEKKPEPKPERKPAPKAETKPAPKPEMAGDDTAGEPGTEATEPRKPVRRPEPVRRVNPDRKPEPAPAGDEPQEPEDKAAEEIPEDAAAPAHKRRRRHRGGPDGIRRAYGGKRKGRCEEVRQNREGRDRVQRSRPHREICRELENEEHQRDQRFAGGNGVFAYPVYAGPSSGTWACKARWWPCPCHPAYRSCRVSW